MIVDSSLGAEPKRKATSRRTGLHRDLGDPLPSSWHRLATVPHGPHGWLLGPMGLLGSSSPSVWCFSCQVHLMVQSSGGNHLHLSQKKECHLLTLIILFLESEGQMLISFMLMGIWAHASPRNAHTGPYWWGNPTSDLREWLGCTGSPRPPQTSRVTLWLGWSWHPGCRPRAAPGEGLEGKSTSYSLHCN